VSAEPRVSPQRLLAIVVVFTFLGPTVGAMLFVVLFGTVGIITMGPFAIFGGLMYFFWWLPSLYAVYGPPFLLTGLLYALAVRFFAPASLLNAVIAGAVGFAVYLGARYGLTGSLAETDKIIGPHAWSEPQSIAGMILIGVVPSWWLVRDRTRPIRWF
jgi:hypothetical protein